MILWGFILRLTGGSKALGGMVVAGGVALAFLGVFWAGTAWNERGNKIDKLETDLETGNRIDGAAIPDDVDDGLRGLSE